MQEFNLRRVPCHVLVQDSEAKRHVEGTAEHDQNCHDEQPEHPKTTRTVVSDALSGSGHDAIVEV